MTKEKNKYQLEGKKILIISPQSWEHIWVSKHHYAIELSEKNMIYFLNPPKRGKFNGNVTTNKIKNNLHIVNWSLIFPYNLKFHAERVFDVLLNLSVKFFLLKKLPKLDVVWSFSSLYLDLNAFNADLKIYHPVDLKADRGFSEVAKTADIVFGVTQEILSKINHSNKYLIGHGLSNYFIRDSYFKVNQDSINVAYCGNLDMKHLNVFVLLELIKKYSQINFHFIGPFSKNNNFVLAADKYKNTYFYGKVASERVAKIYENIDVFMLCYDIKSEFSPNKGANSHKLIEYLSTGKVVVANYVKMFDGTDLFEMNLHGSNTSYIELFDKIVKNLSFYNSEAMIKKRIAFARQNTYHNRILEIENLINKSCQK